MKLYTATALAATATGASASTYIQGDFSAAVRYANYVGLTSVIITIEESPDGFNVTDANSKWYTLATFTTLIGPDPKQEKLLIIDPHFSKLRAVATLVGSGTVDIDVYVEGVEV